VLAAWLLSTETIDHLSMRNPPSPAIIRWLRDNGMSLGVLTHHDTTALLAATQIAALWMHGGDREAIATAFRNVVLEMQPHARYLAYHAIAHVGDWHNRPQLWHAAQLPQEDLLGRPECKFGPRKEAA
jgi:hypothetical protein